MSIYLCHLLVPRYTQQLSKIYVKVFFNFLKLTVIWIIEKWWNDYSSYPFNLHQQFFLVKIWSNLETMVSFRFCSSRRFQNTPWKSKLTKI